MEVSTEAKRIMVVALGKLYSSRTQRGGLRLHRSLLLSLVMKSARDIYHSAQATAQSAASGWGEAEEQQHQQQQQGHSAAEMSAEPAPELQGARTLLPQEDAGSPVETEQLRRGAHTRTSAEDKENLRPPVPPQQTRKRRGKAAADPDFLPCKKAKLEQGSCSQPLVVGSVLMDYVKCSSGVAAPIPLQRAIAAC